MKWMGLPRKALLIGTGAMIVVVLAVGGWLWHSHSSNKQTTGRQTVGNHTISLDQGSDGSGSGGLSVSAGGAYDLGQLGGNQSKGSQNGSGSSGSSNGGIDPSQFAQYDKYKDGKSSYFGDMKAGTGAALTAGHKAAIVYKVYLTNGALVDQSPVSSSGQPQPFTFTLGGGQVIPGLEQGIAGMKAGGTRLIIVPPAVGYGSQGQGNVPPNAVLVFIVQLSSVQ